MRDRSVWARLLGVEKTVVERVEMTGQAAGLSGDGQLLVVAHVRPGKRSGSRCGICGRRCGGYDRGEGRRRWRALDLGRVRAELEAAAPRVTCPAHGVTVVAVPWARHGAGHTRYFDDTAAWLACVTSRTTITTLMRISRCARSGWTRTR